MAIKIVHISDLLICTYRSISFEDRVENVSFPIDMDTTFRHS